jgi:RNA polymerase sigma factor (sigma-70 family)
MNRQDFVAACQQGGKAMDRALRALVADYGHALRRDAWSLLRDEERVRDLVQDVLLKVWEKCGSFRGDSELFPWLKQVMRHGAIDQLRRMVPETPLHDDQGQTLAEVETALRRISDEPDNQPEASAEQAQHDAIFQRCAARFAEEQPLAAQVMRWIVEDELQPADIAALLQRSPGATREFISQCRKKARVYFAEWYQALAASGATNSGGRSA